MAAYQNQNDPSTRTSPTLLLRLRDLSDQSAWGEFLERYGPKIYAWCRRYHLQEADATDVTQDVLTKLVRAMRQFEYSPARGSFRGWLKTVTNNTIRDLTDSWKRPGRASGDSREFDRLLAIQSPEALSSLASEIGAEAERELLDEAAARVRIRVKPHTWRAYEMTAVEGRPAAEVAAQLGIRLADVYVAKSRVIKLLREEVERLNHAACGVPADGEHDDG